MEENRKDNLGEAISEEAVAKAVSESEKVAGEVSLESTEAVETEATSDESIQEAGDAEVPKEMEAVTAEVPIAEVSESENPETTEAQEQAVLASESADNPMVGDAFTDASQPKKKSKLALTIGIGIAAAVAVVGIGVAAVGSLFQNNTVKFLQYQEAFLEEKTAGIVESLKQWEDMDTDITISGKFLDTSGDAFGLSSYLEGSSLVMKVKSDAKKEQALLNYIFTMQGTPILEYGISMDKEEVAFAVPSVDENLYTGNLRTIYKNLTGIELKKVNYDTKELEDILKPYFVDFTQSFSKKSLQVNRAIESPYDNTMTVTEYVFMPSQEETVDYIEKIAKRMQSDDKMKDIYNSSLVGYGTTGDMPSYEEAIENLLSRKEDIANDLVNREFSWTLGVKSNQVVYIRIMDMGIERFSYVKENDPDEIYELYTFDGQTFTNQYKEEGGRMQGILAYEGYGAGDVSVSYDYNPKEMSKLGLYEGQYEIVFDNSSIYLNVDLNGGEDSHIFNFADMIEVVINTTKTSSATKLSGSEVDINDWTQENFMSYLESIGMAVQEVMYQMIGF